MKGYNNLNTKLFIVGLLIGAEKGSDGGLDFLALLF
jgi:hypothetical protein